VIDRINRFGTDLLVVGMGTPIQEKWVHQHRVLFETPAILTAGACMEYVAGVVRTPPRWMGRYGLEWSFRLVENPRRFAYRYLVEPWILGLHLVRHSLVRPDRKTL
jgi:N-acetylglucosaminyldiphosphoundecaprenol N-acetyl-beta-D-mannosaminyltransferase